MRNGRDRTDLGKVLGSPYWNEEQAEVVLSAWSASGQSVVAFARANGVHEERLRRWRRRLKVGEAPTFHPVRVVERSDEVCGDAGGLELVLRGGRRVVVSRGFDPEHLRRVVQVVEGWEC